MATSYQQLAFDACCTGDLDRDALIRWSTESTARGHSSTPRSRFLWDCIRLAAAKASAEIIRYILEMGRGCGIQASTTPWTADQLRLFRCSSTKIRPSSSTWAHTTRSASMWPSQLRATGEDGLGDATASQRRRPFKANAAYVESGISFVPRSGGETRRTRGAAAESGFIAYSHIYGGSRQSDSSS